MISFFKNFGKGVLYVLVLPFLLVGMALYGVVALFIFIFLAFKGLILFFTGRSLYEDLPEDIEAKKRLGATAPGSEQASSVEVTNEDISSALNGNQKQTNTVDTNDPFYVPEYLKSEQPEEENIMKEEPEVQEEFEPQEQFMQEPEVPEEEAPAQQEEMVIKPSFVEEPDDVSVEEEEIILEKTEQKSNIFEVPEDDDDDDKPSGVNIDFD